jgi:DNA-directed RNA polymerase specialized sigma24 family protein
MKKNKKDLLWACQRTLLRCAAAARRRYPGSPLSTRSIVQEAYLRMRELHALDDDISETHFRMLAAKYMHYVLKDASRKRRRRREEFITELDDGMGAERVSMEGMLSIAEALDRLKTRNERQYDVALATWFGGCTAEQVAEQLSITVPVVKHELDFLRAWRNGLLTDDGPKSRTR